MKSRIISSVFIVLLCMLTSCSSSYNNTENIVDMVCKSRGRPLKTEGPRIDCRDLTSEEINQLNIPELTSGDCPGIKILETRELCPGDEYALYRFDVRNKSTLVTKFIAGEGEVSHKVLLVIGNTFMKGEPVSFALVNQKTNSVLATSLCPNPIQISWDDGATVTATALDESMDIWYSAGNGFQAGEVLRTSSKSWNEVVKSESRASDTGRFIVLTLPGVIGKTGGINYVTYERDSGEKRTLEIPYGSEAFR